MKWDRPNILTQWGHRVKQYPTLHLLLFTTTIRTIINMEQVNNQPLLEKKQEKKQAEYGTDTKPVFVGMGSKSCIYL